MAVGASSPISPFLFPLLLLLLAAVAAGPSLAASEDKWDGRLPGGYQPIEDVNDPHIRELGQFAVYEHNRQSGGRSQLVFSRVVSGQQQVVAGMNYDLVVEASGSGGAGPAALYEAVVYELATVNIRKLISFQPKAAGAVQKKTSTAN